MSSQERGRGRGRGRGGFRRGGRSNASSFVCRSPAEMSPAVAILRAGALEVVTDQDMMALYEHGFYGKGTVSRRVPNRGAFEVIPLADDEIPSGPPAGKRARVEEADASAMATDIGASNTAATATSASSSSDMGGGGGAPVPDILAAVADAFEAKTRSAPLPEAFSAAALAITHGQQPVSFETARQVAHYISCPPPRVRQLNDTSGTGTGTGKQGVPSGHVLKAMRETSILEPEAGLYLLERFPDKLFIYQQVATPGIPEVTSIGAGTASADATHASTAAAAVDTDATMSVGAVDHGMGHPHALTPSELWTHACHTVQNFPARYALYRTMRDKGWIVRDGGAFGCDFVLYARGPGIDHAPHCVTITPLRLQTSGGTLTTQPARACGTTSAATTVGSTVCGGVSGGNCVDPEPARRIPESWLELHALSRVVNNVKKNTLLAYVTLQLGDVSVVPVDMTSNIECISHMTVETVVVRRWLIAKEQMKKTTAFMRQAVLAVTQSNLHNDTDINLSVLEQATGPNPTTTTASTTSSTTGGNKKEGGGGKVEVRRQLVQAMRDQATQQQAKHHTPVAVATVVPLVLTPAYDDADPSTNLASQLIEHVRSTVGLGNASATASAPGHPFAVPTASVPVADAITAADLAGMVRSPQFTALLAAATANLYPGGTEGQHTASDTTAATATAVDAVSQAAVCRQWYQPSKSWVRSYTTATATSIATATAATAGSSS